MQNLTTTLVHEIRTASKIFREKRKLGIPKMMVFVMIMLHYLPRLSKKTNPLTDTVLKITARPPGILKAFMEREKTSFDP